MDDLASWNSVAADRGGELGRVLQLIAQASRRAFWVASIETTVGQVFSELVVLEEVFTHRLRLPRFSLEEVRRMLALRSDAIESAGDVLELNALQLAALATLRRFGAQPLDRLAEELAVFLAELRRRVSFPETAGLRLGEQTIAIAPGAEWVVHQARSSSAGGRCLMPTMTWASCFGCLLLAACGIALPARADQPRPSNRRIGWIKGLAALRSIVSTTLPVRVSRRERLATIRLGLAHGVTQERMVRYLERARARLPKIARPPDGSLGLRQAHLARARQRDRPVASGVASCRSFMLLGPP